MKYAMKFVALSGSVLYKKKGKTEKNIPYMTTTKYVDGEKMFGKKYGKSCT